MKLQEQISIYRTDANCYNVTVLAYGTMLANTRLTADEALWAVAEHMIKGSSRFLQAPIALVRQEVRFRGLANAFGGDR